MKTVHLINNVVAEIIPDYAQPVEKWYGAEFAAFCRSDAPDDVEQGWVYDPESGIYSTPPEPEPPEPPEDDETTKALKILLGVE